MKLFDLRKQLKNEFKSLEIETEDVDFIIAEILGVKRTELVLIDEMAEDKIGEVLEKCEMRKNNIPVDKIFRKAYFYGYEFMVDNKVLTPRPESEMIVEKALKYINENNYKTCLDLCTGSGCLAIATQLKSGINMLAIDISRKALRSCLDSSVNLFGIFSIF